MGGAGTRGAEEEPNIHHVGERHVLHPLLRVAQQRRRQRPPECFPAPHTHTHAHLSAPRTVKSLLRRHIHTEAHTYVRTCTHACIRAFESGRGLRTEYAVPHNSCMID